MDTNYYIRSITLSDQANFNELEIEAFPNDEISKDDFERYANNPGFFGCFTKNKDLLIGYLILILSSDYGHLGRIGVHKDFRGKGYGKILMNYAIDYFNENNCKEVGIYLETKNTTAFNLYKQFGFEIEFESWHFIVDLIKFDQEENLLSIAENFSLVNVNLQEIKEFSKKYPEINFQEMKAVYDKLINEKNPRIQFLGLKKHDEIVGFARFAKHFSGSKPFIVTKVKYANPFIQLLKKFKLPEKDYFRFTFDKNKELADLFTKKEYKLHHHLYKMRRV